MGVSTTPSVSAEFHHLVVKNSFLEYEQYPARAIRQRSFTDSDLCLLAAKLESAKESENASSQVHEEINSDWDAVNKNATKELKAFLGLGHEAAAVAAADAHPSAAETPVLDYGSSPFLTPIRARLSPPALPCLPALDEDGARSESSGGYSWAECDMSGMVLPPAECGMTWWVPVSFDSMGQPCIGTPSAEFSAAVEQSRMSADEDAYGDNVSYTPQCWTAHTVMEACANMGEVPESMRTTVILRNLPNNYTRQMLLDLIDSEGFACKYDFVYIPVDFGSQAGLGYAFINLVTPEVATDFWEHFEGFRNWCLPSEKVCTLNWSNPIQGFPAHVERYRNSPVMHHDVPDDWKPVIFLNGERLEFPPPTKPIKAPKIRNRAAGAPNAARN